MTMRNSTKSFGRFSLILLMGALALSGCESVWDPDSSPPEVNEVGLVETSVVEGGTMSVTVDAEGLRPVRAARVTVSGAFDADTVIDFGSSGTSVTDTVVVAVPFGTGPSATATVTVRVVDSSDKESEPASTEVTIRDATAPEVTAEVSPTVVGSGEVIRVTVTASDNREIQRAGVIASNGGGWTLPMDSVLPAGQRTFTHTFEFAAPDTIPVGRIQVHAYALDGVPLEVTSDTYEVLLTDESGPAILELRTNKTTYPLGDSVLVTTRMVDPTGIKSVSFVGTAVRGDPAYGEDTTVVRFEPRTVTYPRTQADTLYKSLELRHWLYTNDRTTAEMVEIWVAATDSLGNVTQAVDTIFVGGPDVGILFPAGDTAYIPLGRLLEVKIKVQDTRDILSAFLALEGARNDTFQLSGFTQTDTIITYPITVPSSATQFTMRALATNSVGIQGSSRLVVVVTDEETALPNDTVPPVVSLRVRESGTVVDGVARLELTDTVSINVLASDVGTGLERMGLWAVATRWDNGVETKDTLRVDQAFATPTTNERELDFSVPMDELYGMLDPAFAPGTPGLAARFDSIAPDTMELEIFAFAADTAGLVACAVGVEESRRCREVSDSTTAYFAPIDAAAFDTQLILVRGRSVALGNRAATIADLAVDTLDERLFLSNISDNLVEVLQLAEDPRGIGFLNQVQVGSQPWGVFIGDRVVSASDAAFRGGTVDVGDTVRTLIVANSGGTNMSLVHLDPVASRIQEVDVVRLQTPNTVIYQIRENLDEFGNTRYSGEWFDFSDRPQFVAQDSLLRLVYSTVPTASANTSTVRYGITDPDPQPTSPNDTIEVRMLITDDMVNTNSETTLALANIDSIDIRAYAAESDSVRVFTHEPGYPGRVIYNFQWRSQITQAVLDVIAQLDAVMAARGVPEQAPLYYPYLNRGSWDFDALGMSDTTFVAASGDRGKVVIGEGASGPTGRIIMWHATQCDTLTNQCATLSDEVQIQDLISNASERVLGVGLNQNGSLGVARGMENTYFFTPDLRLQGLFQQADVGGAGAALHPDHNSVTDGGHQDATGAGAAFTGTSNRSIDVVNTYHFNQITSLHIRDNIVGPLKAGPPLDTDNGGQGGLCVALATTETARRNCVVAKLYGVTDDGGVVVVNVRRRDLE